MIKMSDKEAREQAAELNKKCPGYPNLFSSVWCGVEEGFRPLKREYTSAEKEKISAGVLCPAKMTEEEYNKL